MSTKPAYRPDIDGLRAVAVLSVVLYHYGATWLPGGFTGVDVFFVISGFVITAKLRKEMEAGAFSILGFYDGRVRRIFPALLTMLAVTMAAGWFILMPGDYANLGESAAFAAFGLGNLFFLWNSGYFDQASELQPLLHTWSLGVEEQFYVVWPLILWLALRFLRSPIALAGLCLTIVVGGLIYAQYLVSTDPTAAFYLALPRSWELAVGAALIFLPAVHHRLMGNIMAAAGALLIAYSLLFIQADGAFPGLAAAYACFGAALIVWPKNHTLMSAALSFKPIVFIGLISYSLYLWHWPVLVLYRHYANGDMPSTTASTVLVGISALFSVISWRYVERPFRSRSALALSAAKLVPSAFLIAALVSSSGLLISTFQGWPIRVTEEATRLNNIDAMWAWQCPAQVMPTGSPNERCSFGADWSSSTNRALLWGDSHAQHLVPILDVIGKEEGISFILRESCPAALGLSIHREWPAVANFRSQCQDVQKDMEAILASDSSIRTVVLASSWAKLAGHRIYSDDQANAGLSHNELIRIGISEVTNRITRLGKKVVLVENLPYPGRNLTRCAAGKASGLFRAPCPTNIDASSRPDELAISDGMLASLARDGLTVVSPKTTMCHADDCISTFRGQLIWRDATHLRRDLPVAAYQQLGELTGLAAALKPD